MLSSLNNYLIPLLIIVIVLLLVIITLGIFVFIIPMNKRMDELSRMMFIMFKKDKSTNYALDSIRKAMLTTHENIRSLSTSTQKVIEEFNDMKTKPFLPTPQLSTMIRETIQEQINIETLLSSNMKIPNKDSTNHIIENTIKTYPNVDREYIIKLCLALIENFKIVKEEDIQSRKKNE